MDRVPRIDLRRYGNGPAGHRHDHHQIVVALEGCMTLDVAGCEGIVSRDAAALVPGGTRHGFEACRESRFLVVDVAGDPGAGPAGEGGEPWRVPRAEPFVAIAPDVRGYLDFLGARAEAGALPAALALPAARLALELLRPGRHARAAVPPVPPALARACRFMAARLDRPASVAEAAAAAASSPSRLHALFREHLGTTPGRWLLGRRLDEAARLLSDTRLPVERVAHAVGFADGSAFGRAFRRSRGLTPLGHRRRARARGTG